MSRVSLSDWHWAKAWTLSGVYALLGLIAAVVVVFFAYAVTHNVRVETQTVTQQVAPDTYEGFVKAYGAGQHLSAADLQAIGAPEGSVCAQWAFPTGYALLCQA